MTRTEYCRITIGTVYRFHQMQAVERDGHKIIEDVEGSLYRVNDFPLDGITLQQKVHYTGIDGRDAGRTFVCSLSNFAARFRPAVPPPPDVPSTAVVAVAGAVTQGTGI